MEGTEEEVPKTDSEVWTLPKLVVVMGFRLGMRKWRRAPVKKVGWKFRSWSLTHEEIGGVTDIVVTIWLAVRNEVNVDAFRSNILGVPAQLSDVLSKTESGRPAKGLCGDQDLLSPTRLLRWENRYRPVRCVSVFYPGRLIMRRMTSRELALALDLPNARVKAYKGDLDAMVRRFTLPGKFIQASVGSVAKLISDYRDIGESDRDQETSEILETDHALSENNSGSSPSAKVGVGSFETLSDDYQRKAIKDGKYEIEVSNEDDESTAVRLTAPRTPKKHFGSPSVGEWEQNRLCPVMLSRTANTSLLEKVGDTSPPGTEVQQDTREGPSLTDDDAFNEPNENGSSGDDDVAAEATTTVTSKAVKADDAAAPVHLWDDFILDEVEGTLTPERRLEVKRSFDLLRNEQLRRWKLNVRKDFEDWFRDSCPDHLDRNLVRAKGEEAIDRAEAASFWSWDKGSSPFFWRWDPEYLEDMLIGGPVRFDRVPKPWFRKARLQGTEASRLLMRKKIEKFLDKGYIKLVGRDEVTSLLNVFAVSKGLDDIRPVFDATKSGLNECLYTPWFHLPGADSLTDELLPGYWNADNDYGEQFLNFPLNPQLMRYCGVDLTPYFPELSSDEICEVIGMWWRNLMGLQCSPYLSVQGAQRAKRLILGDRLDPSNPFQWSRVELNLPGDENYDPTLPRVMRVRKDGELATAIHNFVDDLRTTAAEQKRAWLASTRIGKTLCWLGLQDAPRKRREPSQEPGAWSGVVVSTTGGAVKKFVSDERWDKTVERVRWFAYMLYVNDVNPPDGSDWSSVRAATPKGSILFEVAERYVGFLRYVAQTYKSMVPYLKGIYLTLNNWRQHRDAEGWKLGAKLIEEAMRAEDFDSSVKLSGTAPKYVKIVRRLRSDINALIRLTATKTAPKVNVRPVSCVVAYLIGDASGSGFGVALWIPGQKPIRFSHGVWDSTNSSQSSNFRESANLILKLKEYLDAGAIPRGAELFIFTDNSCAENAYHNGSSSVKSLHELSLELRELEMAGDLHVRSIWIAGTRMIQTGVDGLSRGDLANGVLSGDMTFLAPLPLNQSVFDRSPQLRTWLDESLKEMALPWCHLSKEGWFDDAFSNPIGAYIWCPPAAAAEAVINSLCDVKHVHPESSHIVVLTCLETQPWRRTLHRLSDCVVELKPTQALWGPEQHESLVLAFVSPFLVSPPFAVKRTRWGIVCVNFGATRGVNRRCCQGAFHAKCYVQSQSDKFPVLGEKDLDDSLIADHCLEEDDPKRFQEARDGDHLLCPFQCDLCHFENIHSRPPNGTVSDEWNMVCIRRANLDAMWSRERSTVDSNRREGERYLRQSAVFGKQDPFPARGPSLDEDSWDMFAAMNVLSRSLDEGRNSKNVQFGTARKVRSCLSNYWHATADGIGGMVLVTEGTTSRVSHSPTHSFWFHRFMEGCHRRMGDVWIPDRPLTIHELKCCLALLEKDWKDFTSLGDAEGLVETSILGSAIVAGFFGALRGEEVCRIDIGAMRKHWLESQSHPDAPHVPLVMTGRFKRQVGEKFFCQPLANKSKSGVNIKIWMERALWCREQQGITTGPLFRVYTKGGKFRKATVNDLDLKFHDVLRRVQERWPTVIPDAVDIKADYSFSRSLRRGSTGEAQNAEIPAEVINENNRWRKSMRARGMTPTMSMRQRYSDAKACVKTLTRYSGGL